MKITFTGVIHPERACVGFGDNARFTMESHLSSGQPLIIAISASCSQVIVELSSEADIVIDVYTLKNGITSFVHSYVDALGYCLGCGYDVEIIHAIDDGGRHTVFSVSAPGIQKINTGDPTERLNNIFPLMVGKGGRILARSLSDLREAIRSPNDTGFFCYRAIENLLNYYAIRDGIDLEKNKATAWSKFHADLGTDRSLIEPIRVRFANAVRHGGDVEMSGPERDSVFEATSRIINQYILFVAKNPLPA